jgi:hypothetical protein
MRMSAHIPDDVVDVETLLLPVIPLPRSDIQLAGTSLAENFKGTAIMNTSDRSTQMPELQARFPVGDRCDKLAAIRDLCEQFFARWGTVPTDISLHWLTCLEFLADGRSGVHGTFHDGRIQLNEDEACSNQIMIPFVASLMEGEDMIIVRGTCGL